MTTQPSDSFQSPAGALKRLGEKTFNIGVEAGTLGISPDGKALMATGHGKLFRFDVDTGAPSEPVVVEPNAEYKKVQDQAFSPDGKLLALALSWRAELRDTQTLELVRQIPTYQLNALAFSPDGKLLATAHNNAQVSIWEVETGQELERGQIDADYPEQISFSPDGRFLVVQARQSVLLLDHRAVPLKVGTPVQGRCHRFCWGPDGATIATSSEGGVVLWDFDSHRIKASIQQGTRHRAGQLAVTPDGSCLVSANYRAVQVWDIATGAERWQHDLGGHSAQIALAPDGGRIFATSSTGSITVLNTRDGQALSGGETAPIGSVHIALDGTLITRSEKMLTAWSTDSGQRLWSHSSSDYLSPVGLLSKGERFISVVGLRDLEVRALKDGSLIQTLDSGIHGGYRIAGLQVLNDDRVLISTYNAAALIKLDPSASKDPSRIHAWNQGGHDLAAAPAAEPPIAILSSRSLIACVALDTGKLLGEWKTQSNYIALSPDGQLLATAGSSSTASLREPTRGTVQWKKKLPGKASITALRFSPDGAFLALGNSEGAIFLLEISTQTLLLPLKGHTSNVNDLVFSSDGARLYSGSKDTTAMVWDLKVALSRRPAPKKSRKKK